MSLEQTMEIESTGEVVRTSTRVLEDEDYWAQLERQYAGQALPEVMRANFEGGLDLDPHQVASDAVLYARALIARLKGETE